MYEHIAAKGNSGIVINATRPVCHVSHDDGQRGGESKRCHECQSQQFMLTRVQPLNDVRYRACEHLQTFWHLKCDHGGIVLSNVVNGFMDFKRVIGR